MMIIIVINKYTTIVIRVGNGEFTSSSSGTHFQLISPRASE